MRPRRIAKRLLVAGGVVLAGTLVWIAAPAVSLTPFVPKAIDFSMPDRHFDRGTFEVVQAGAARGRGSSASHHPALFYTSPELVTPGRFNMVGLTWRGTDRVRAWLRTRARGEKWSSWTEVPTHEEEGPDGRSREKRRGDGLQGTYPAWAGDADEVQYRLRGRLDRVSRVRLHFVNSTGSRTTKDRIATSIRGAAHTAVSFVGKPFRAQAEAAVEMPGVITRDEWGASQCPPRSAPGTGSVTRAVVHHTVTTNDYSPSDSKRIVLGICSYHRNSRGWNDIGYNFLVDKYGQIFEGRYGGMDRAVVGAHAQGYNSTSAGVANMGDHASLQQTQEGMDALARIIAWKFQIHGVTVAEVPFGKIVGHGDVNSTDCPGAALAAQLPDLRGRVVAKMQGGDSIPPPQAPDPPKSPRAKVSLSADLSVVGYQGQATVTGSLRIPSAGGVAGGQAVTIERRRVGREHEWEKIGDLATDADGNFTAVIVADRTAKYRAVFPGIPGARRATSKSRMIRVRRAGYVKLRGARASSAARRSSVPARARRKIVGSFAPATRSATLIVQRRRGRAWRTVRSATLAARASGQIKVWHTFAPGKSRVKLLSPKSRSYERTELLLIVDAKGRKVRRVRASAAGGTAAS